MYATGADMLARYDARLLGDLASDVNVPVTPSALPSNINLTSAITDASAAITAAVFSGDRYTPAQLATLSGVALSLMKRLTCDLALIYMKRRRGKFDPEKDGALLKETNEAIKRLRDGDDYLMLSTTQEAEASVLELVIPNPRNPNRPLTAKRQTWGRYYPVDREGYCGDGVVKGDY
jgi:phage gp36-like protein